MSNKSPSAHGFTLVELVVVVTLIALISLVVVSRFDSIGVWQRQSSVRNFAETWEFLAQQSAALQRNYRLIVDIDHQSYFVREEIDDASPFKTVDHLANMRTKGEKRRRQEKQNAVQTNLDEEFKAEHEREQAPLSLQLYHAIFRDPYGNYHLSLPLDFPSLGDEHFLGPGIVFHDVKVHGSLVTEGQVAIRFSSRSGSEFAIVHLEADNAPISIVMSPTTGGVTVHNEYLDFEWNVTPQDSGGKETAASSAS